MKYTFSCILIMAVLIFSLPVYAKNATSSGKVESALSTDVLPIKDTNSYLLEEEEEFSGHMNPAEPFFSNKEAKSHIVIKKLPPPQRERKGISLMQALNKRKTNRLIKDEALSDQELSNILWAAWGMVDNQRKHTTPTYPGTSVDIYVSLPDGLWLYKPCRNHLEQVLAESIIEKYDLFTTELFYATHPDEISYMLLGSIYQNVMLYCSSRGLYNTLRGSKIPLLEGKFPLSKDFKLVLSQGVGWPR